MNWLVFSLMAAGLWGLWGFLSKVATLQLPAGTVFFNLRSRVRGGHRIPGGNQGTGYSLASRGLAAALGAGICMAFGLLYFFKVLAEGVAADVVVPLTALYPLVTVILSWTLLREGLSLRQLAGLALALPAVWLLSK